MVRPEVRQKRLKWRQSAPSPRAAKISPARSRQSRNVRAKIARAEKENNKAPDYRVFAGTTEFGAAWKRTSATGREYLSVKLDDPSFPAPIFASLVATEGGDAYALIWSRRNSD